MQDHRGYNLEHLGTFPMIKIKAKGQGAVPGDLGGLFTTKTEAIKAIDLYLDGLTKGRRNGKTKAASAG